MFAPKDFFQHLLEGFPCPTLLQDHIDGYLDLKFVWDILKRLQSGFVGANVKPQIRGYVEEGAILKGEDIYIGKNSRVMAGAMIIGPVIIGNNVTIRHGAFIRGNVIIGDDAVIGHATEVIRSVLFSGAKAPHFNYVGDCILGSGVNLGAGTKLSNFKNDGTEVRVKAAGTTYNTELRKFGAILGDGCLLGCNSVTNPGTLMGAGCRVYANTTVSGYHAPGTIVKLRQQMETTKVE